MDNKALDKSSAILLGKRAAWPETTDFEALVRSLDLTAREKNRLAAAMSRRLLYAIWPFCSMRNGYDGQTKISRSWESRGVYSGNGEEEQWVAKATAEMLKRFDNDQAVAAAEKEFVQAQEIEADFDGLDST